jgi:hypothetical protein
MRKTWLVLAVFLAGSVAVCRAEEQKIDDKPAASDKKADAKVMKKDDGKDYVEAVDAKDIAPAAPCAPKSGIVCAAPDRCYVGRGAECCQRIRERGAEHCQHIWDWLTYRPLKKPCLTGCCHKCGGCHVPPLYLYFLDPYHACAPGNGCATCAAPGCASCGQP